MRHRKPLSGIGHIIHPLHDIRAKSVQVDRGRIILDEPPRVAVSHTRKGQMRMAINCADCDKELTPQQAGVPCPQCGSLDRNMTAEDGAALVEEKNRVAKYLATKHYQVEGGLTRIFRLTGAAEVEVKPAEPIKL